ncbi:MAG: MBL fold metallo-hydrolase, partial [bacterium]
MEYEVDFLPVGEESKGGDAIALRIWNPSEGFSSQFVMVIDGGTKNAGEALVEHIKKYYDTEDVDVVLATHCHSDHTSGLSVVLEKLKVKSLYMHKPWEHSENITNLFKS